MTITIQLLGLSLYRFMTELVRVEDQVNGGAFLERLLTGPQEQWEYTDQRIKNLVSFWSVVDIEDEYLQYLKWIVGWTSELSDITDNLDSDTLRRLIQVSVPFWKKLGVEDAVRQILFTVSGMRLRIWNWFDLRSILDVTYIGEQHQGTDPYLLSVAEEKKYNIRIVDDGNLYRDIIKNLAKLSRPGGERIDINYLGFLDLFSVDDDTSQWTEPTPSGTTVFEVVDGALRLGSTTTDTIYSDIDVSWNSWDQISIGTRIKFLANGATSYFSILFHVVDSNNYYVLEIYPSSYSTGPTIELVKYVSGTPTTLQSVYLGAEMIIGDDIWYYYRINVIDDDTNRILKVYIGNVEYISIVESSPVDEGGVRISTYNGIVEVDEFEIMRIWDGTDDHYDFININS